MNDTWQYLLDMNDKSIDELGTKLNNLPSNSLFDAVQTIEQLNIRLMLEYNVEVNRGKNL